MFFNFALVCPSETLSRLNVFSTSKNMAYDDVSRLITGTASSRWYGGYAWTSRPSQCTQLSRIATAANDAINGCTGTRSKSM